jgi:hypothetical protein
MTVITNFAKSFVCRWSFLTAIGILAGVGVIKWQASLMPENTYVPMPKGPTPNARDIFLQAEALMKGNIDQYTSSPAPAGTTPAQIADPSSPYYQLTLAQREAMVRENLPAIAKLEEGLKYQYFAVQPRSASFLMPYLAKDRAMARALVFAGKTREEHGDADGAMRYYMDAIHLGNDLPHGAIMIGALVGDACDAIGRRGAEGVFNQLDITGSKSAISQLEQFDQNRTPTSETIIEEKWLTQGALLNTFRSRSWERKWWVSGVSVRQLDLIDQAKAVNESPRTAYDHYTTYMNKLTAFAAQPWPVEQKTRAPKLPTDPINQILLPVFDGAIFQAYVAQTMDRLLEIQIGLHAYKLRHGAYPNNLSDLKPELNSKLPIDPFSHQPFKYQKQGETYLLYSVGPDGVDDHGKPVAYTPNATAPYIVAGPDQKGDIVAGINR